MHLAHDPLPGTMTGTLRFSARGWVRAIGLMLLVLTVSACSLPRSAAMQSEVLRGTQGDESDFQVVEVTRDALDEIGAWPRPAGAVRYSWVGTGASATTRLIRAGDLITLAIWDSQDTSLLTTQEQRVADMADISVSTSGRIFVPYVGEIMVAGMTADAARRDIQEQMEMIVPDAQVQLSVSPGSENTIDMVTGVASPGRIPLTEISPTILTALSEAGGINANLRNPLVRLQRAGHSYAIPANRLFSDPSQDIQLRGGDRILVEQDQRNFIALGAAGRQEVVYFEREDISALDALSTIGGLSSARADLQGVMVLREYEASDVREEGAYPRKPQVIFSFDLTNADGLFAAQRFLIEPDDVVLATESPAPAFTQVLSLFRTASNTF
ncbi:MAG: polysaccharide export outer membrane protein [Rhodobacteraceae bacterium HLUCCA12]|nr:MAG: polysaccharide export outer membrane protein [Rhodobacteraceae bacterium HLUCCA12]